MVRFLHDQGYLLYYDRHENLKDWIILNPQWLADVFCMLINARQQKNIGHNMKGMYVCKIMTEIS